MGNWSIELEERPLNANWFVKLFIEKTDSHSFISVKNDKRETVLELHGLYSSGIGAVFNTAAKVLLGRPAKWSRLHVEALTSPRLMKIFTAHLPVTSTLEVSDSEDKILRATETMVRAAREINNLGADYYFDLRGGGKTCHSVSAELLRRVGVDMTKQALPFTTPGRLTDLEEEDPALRRIIPDNKSPLSSVRTALERELEITGISPDFAKSPFWHHQNGQQQLSSAP